MVKFLITILVQLYLLILYDSCFLEQWSLWICNDLRPGATIGFQTSLFNGVIWDLFFTAEVVLLLFSFELLLACMVQHTTENGAAKYDFSLCSKSKPQVRRMPIRTLNICFIILICVRVLTEVKFLRTKHVLWT